jgi:hypothetical protein
VQTLATLRGGKPLLLEKQVGQGRVIACLTTLAPEWNDWAKNPSFVVMVLKLQSYLAASSREDEQRLVGDPMRLELEATRYLPEVTLVQPASAGDGTTRTSVRAHSAGQDSPLLVALLGGDARGRRNGHTDRAGIYEAWTTTLLGETQVHRFALNVDPSEGNLATANPAELSLALAPVQVDIQKAENVSYLAARQSGYNRSLLVMLLLVGLLLAEQALAYSASYHTSARSWDARSPSLAGGAP